MREKARKEIQLILFSIVKLLCFSKTEVTEVMGMHLNKENVNVMVKESWKNLVMT